MNKKDHRFLVDGLEREKVVAYITLESVFDVHLQQCSRQINMSGYERVRQIRVNTTTIPLAQ